MMTMMMMLRLARLIIGCATEVTLFLHLPAVIGSQVSCVNGVLGRQLLFTAEHIASTRSASSVSILDFVVRGMFMPLD